MTRTALVAALAVLMLSTAAKSQDPGIPDTIAIIATMAPDAQASQLKFTFELWVFNDEELAAANMGFGWDNANLTLDSAKGTSLTTGGFPIGPFYYEDNSLATSNANNRCLFGGVAISPLFPSGATRRHWATYYFTLSNWDETDVLNVDSLAFNDASIFQLVQGSQVPFTPNWLGGIHIIDPNAPPNLILSTDSLHFSCLQGGPAPTFQNFIVTSSGNNIAFTLSEDSPWLIPSPISATTPRTIRVDINNIGLLAGDYIDTIVVSSGDAGNTPLQVVVTLTVIQPPPVISATPASFFFNAIANDTNPDPKTLTIKNVGGGVLNWSLTHAQSWLGLNPTSGTDSGDVEVSIDITGLSLGNYTDTIVVSDPAASNNPRKVPVTLSVSSDLPIIVVDSTWNYVVVKTGVAFDSTYINVSNGGGGTMDFWIQWNSPRITEIDPDTATAPADVKMRIRLAAGVEGTDYYDTVWVYSNQAINSPVPVLMLLHYVGEPAILDVSPQSIEYSLYECAQGLTGLPQDFSFTVNNNGGDDPMFINIDYASDLFTVEPLFTSAPGFFVVSTKNLVLPVGVYKDTIRVVAFKSEPNEFLLVVTLNVISATQTPQIHLMDSVFTFTAQEEHGPTLEKYTIIRNKFGGCLDWHVENNIPWTTVFDTAGNVPDTIGIYPTAIGLVWGTHTDSFYITSSVASNSPKKVKIIFKVWKLHGDNNWDGKLNILDLVYLVDYIFRGSGLLPQPERAVGDVNCDELLNIQDLTYLVDYFFRQGPIPCGNPFKK